VQDIGLPGSVIGTFQGNAQAFQSSLARTPVLIGAALLAVYIILGVLYCCLNSFSASTSGAYAEVIR
jgi:multidrug efflux pump subunit AcrB